jgi:hypothetical protein
MLVEGSRTGDVTTHSRDRHGFAYFVRVHREQTSVHAPHASRTPMPPTRPTDKRFDTSVYAKEVGFSV